MATFEKLAKLAFRERGLFETLFSRIPFVARYLTMFPPFKIPILTQVLQYFVSYLADGRYSAQNIEAALKEVFGVNRTVLDYSHATWTGTKVGLPVATVDSNPSCRVFTNYNGVGERAPDQGRRPTSCECSN